MDVSAACTVTFIAARTLPVASRTGAATDRTPGASSSSASAHPWARTRTSSALRAATDGAGRGGSPERLAWASASVSMLLLIVAAASVLVAIAIGVFYVQRRLVRRLTSVGDAMRRLSSGETDLAVPAAADSDEIGEMARSLEVFRAGEIERREMAGRAARPSRRRSASAPPASSR